MSSLAPAIPGYALLHEIGRGGMGVVWLARQLSLDRLVAVKVLAPGAEVDLARFRREGRLVQKLAHPGIVRLYDYDVDAAVPHLVFEYVDGARTLARVLTLETLGRERAAAIGLAVAEALAHVHAAAIVHRDVKPGNVLIGRDERARLIDLGLAKSLAADATRDLTRSGELMGTLSYMAPEQMQGVAATPRADVYALGLVLHELFAERIVFAGEGPGVVRPGHRLRGEIPALTEAPPEVARVVARCVEADPAERFADGGEVAEALRTALSGRRSRRAERARRRTWIRKLAPPAVLIASLLFAVASVTLVLRSSARLPDGQVVASATPSPPGPDRVALARRLQRRLQAVRPRLDERWLAGFAHERRAALLARSASREVARALKAHLEDLAVQPALDEFLVEARAYFADASVPEPERWAMRSDLCEVELLEHFCREHAVAWPAAASLEGVAGEWDRPVEPERVEIARGRSWVVRESWYEPFEGAARTVAFSVEPLPARQALLWFSTTAWRPGYLVEVLVNRRWRRLVAGRPGAEPPRLNVRAVEYRDAGGARRDAQIELLSGETWRGERGYLGTWLPPAVLAAQTEVRYRVVAVPLASAAITDAALRERVLTVFSGTSTSP